ncbi:benzoate-CoA ligase family protein [Thalassococcus sp. S3]|uniref:benzoate-CoA ligase family protein n=1 Tax=Thalassococcus sp. S3 TaxID=2017482 RepID=UPI0010246FA8|nr:benzoate-CoA ligase family protein [Thalassococcus sp. S3]QBF31094.1 benzoate-CoA ligase family protein [Thalassococcus sp. S3]
MTDPDISSLAAAIGFDLPENYNAARLLWDNLETRAEKPAIFHDSGTWTYRTLAEEAGRIGNYLRQLASPGDRIVMFLDDEPAYPAAIMGALRAGLVPMLINTLSPPELIAFFIEDGDAKAVITSDPFMPLFASAGVAILNVAERPWADIAPDLAEHPTRRGDMAFWMYSSGSTGRPKGIVHKHEDAAYTAESYARSVLDLKADDICFSVPKIFFAYGFGNSITFPFAVGAASVLLSGRPTAERIFEQIARHRPTVFFGLPTLYTALAHDPAADAADLSSVRLCISAAEILSTEIAEAWSDRFGHRIVEGLGSTEVLHIYLSNQADMQKSGSAGQVVPGYAIRLRTPEDREAETGEEGIMQVRGLSAAQYYWNRPEKTAETMRDGWIHTGDRFVRDDEGFYFFKGRADDLVKVSGQWVYPMEIELALNEHPKVFESCVQAIELPDQRLTLRAWIALRDGVAGDAALTSELQAHAKTQLLPHKYPREIVYLDQLPKTGTGKIDRQAMRDIG